MRQPRWQPRRLLAAPHRLGFFAAACLLGFSALWWLAWLLSRHLLDLAWPWTLSPGLAHGTVFSFGFMPLLFAGFLFTAGPKWLRVRAVAARELLPAVGIDVAGWLLFGAGVHLHRTLAAVGLLAVALAWSALLWRLAAMLRASREVDGPHLRVILAAGGLGALVLLMIAAALVASREDLARAAVRLGLWGFIAPVFLAAAHRLLPVYGELWLLLVLCLAQGLLSAPFIASDDAAPLWRGAQAVVDGGGALLVVVLAWRWARLRGLPTRMVRMLYLGLLWLGLSFVLSALSTLLAWPPPAAALHAFTIGFLGSTWLAMATRIAAAQEGRTVAIDPLAWALFLLLQGAAGLRVGAALWPALETALLLPSAAAWAVAVGAWALRQSHGFGRPLVRNAPDTGNNH